MRRAITDVRGVLVGHATNSAGATGCTVVLCEAGAVAGVDVRGAAPGTRETDLLDPLNLIERVHAVLLAGGSAFGLAAADGVMRYLEERGVGFDVGVTRVPIVPAAVLFDLNVGDPFARPDAAMGRAACEAAGPDVAEGAVGAGTGATVGAVLGLPGAMRGGVGTWSLTVAGGATVGALAAVNAFGDVVDERTGEVIAGARDSDGRFVGTEALVLAGRGPRGFGANTTLAVVATDARLTKAQATRLAALAHIGLGRVVRPSHTLLDGDLVFALSTGEVASDPLALGVAAANAVAAAVQRAVRIANGLPAA